MAESRKPREYFYPKRPHSSGQARIKIRGKPVYLGKFGSPESYEKFHRIIAELYASEGIAEPITVAAARGPITVARLVLAFDDWGRQRYVKDGKPTSELACLRLALKPVVRLYGGSTVDQFGPLALIACRKALIDRGYSREKVNSHVGRIRWVFKWGVSRELVPVAVWQALTAVAGLRRGEGGREPDPVRPVLLRDVFAIRRHLLPPVKAMIRLQLRTGARPGEICLMRPCDIERTKDCWVFRPASHKTEHHDRSRTILLGPRAQRLLVRWIAAAPSETDYLFSPRRAVQEQRQRRTTMGTNRKPAAVKPKRKPGAKYTHDSYRRAVQRACERAGVPTWSPNQLRHTAATAFREKYGIEVARILLGHAHIATTEIYAEADAAKAAAAIRSVG